MLVRCSPSRGLDNIELVGSGSVLSVTENVEIGAGARRNPVHGGIWYQRFTGDGKRNNFLFWCNHEKQKAEGVKER